MVTRLLNLETETALLAGTELEDVVPFFPEDTRVIVVEDGDRSVGGQGLLRYLHADGFWRHPGDKRGAEIARVRRNRMYEEARASGDRVLLTAAIHARVEKLIQYAGGKQLPGSHWVLPIGDA